MEIHSPVDMSKAIKELQDRVAQLEKDNASLRWQLAEGFRDSVRDFSDSLLDTLELADPPASSDQSKR